MEQLTFQGDLRPHGKTVIVGIGGCSGSGKTALAKELAAELNATLFPFDFYYRDLAHLSIEERTHYNFDHPDSLELDLLVQQVEQLAAGDIVERPIYDFTTHTRVQDHTDPVQPAEVIVVEGILALHYRPLCELYHLSVYVETPHDVCLSRRIYRDVRERGRTEESVRQQFEETARPMADLYVLPSRSRADVVVQGTDSLDWSVEQILRALRDRELLRQAEA